ncbi:MAG: hypothetical protein ACI9FR_000733 [Cryomorphaceae bacterium]
MKRRKFLATVVRGMFLMLALGFFLILFRSLDLTLDNPRQSASIGGIFPDVAMGQTKVQRYRGKRVWVSRLNQAMRQNMSALNGIVVAQQKSCSEQDKLCVIVAATQRDGIELAFSLRPPAQLAADLPWHGGFVNPLDGSVYDLLGRAYKAQSKPLEIVAFDKNVE